jgi:NTE family protein
MSWRQLEKPVAFVLGGGGSLGAMQVGMLEALAEHAIVPDLVVGTSVGAINGAIVAADPQGAAHRLAHSWSRLDSSQVFPHSVIGPLRALRDPVIPRSHRERSHKQCSSRRRPCCASKRPTPWLLSLRT